MTKAGTRIATLTLNPALDLASKAKLVQPMHKIRTTGDHLDPGGGGINVARVVHELGGDVEAILFAGGTTGTLVHELLAEAGVPHRAVPIAGRTRISLTVVEEATGQEYRFVPEGPLLSEAEWGLALHVLETVEAGWVVASGSLPRGVPDDFYARAATIAERRRQAFVLDTSGAALRAAAGSGVTLLKLSLGELESLVGRSARDPEQQQAEVHALVAGGAARMVALTLGQDGALLCTGEKTLWQRPPQTVTTSAVGAGDSFLGALVLALVRGHSPDIALAWGVAAGSVAVGGMGTARLTRTAVEAQVQRVLGSLA